jgi:hypothetical protein
VRLARLRQRLPELFCAEPCQTVKKNGSGGGAPRKPRLWSGGGRGGGGAGSPRLRPSFASSAPGSWRGAGRRSSVGRGKEAGGVLDRGGGGLIRGGEARSGGRELDPARWRRLWIRQRGIRLHPKHCRCRRGKGRGSRGRGGARRSSGAAEAGASAVEEKERRGGEKGRRRRGARGREMRGGKEKERRA